MNDRPLKMERIYPHILRPGDVERLGWQPIRRVSREEMIAMYERQPPPPRMGRSVAGWSAEGVLWYLDVASWLARFAVKPEAKPAVVEEDEATKFFRKMVRGERDDRRFWLGRIAAALENIGFQGDVEQTSREILGGRRAP